MSFSTARDTDFFHHSPWMQLAPKVLETAQNVPTMLSPKEQSLYFWLTSAWAEGDGAIVDLGSFVGGSTARLAAGHKAAGLTSTIHAFDRFTADENTKKNVLYSKGIPKFKGRDILGLSRRLLAPWGDAIEFHPGEIEDNGWHGGPIELLIVDAAKSTNSTDAIAAEFYTSLIPGRSLVVHQDFLHWAQPWLAAQMEMLADCFAPVAYCPNSTMIFACHAVPDKTRLQEARTTLMDDEELIGWLRMAGKSMGALIPDGTFEHMQNVVRANPNQRISWKMKNT